MARRRRRRNRPPIAWGPIFFVLLLGNIVAGIGWSKLTSVGKIRVVGTAPVDEPRIREILERCEDIPALKLDPRRVETLLARKSSVQKAEMTRNIFGRAVVNLEYRVPVAKIQGTGGAVLSSDGVVFQALQPLTGLPQVALSAEAKVPVLTVAGPWRSGDVATLATEIREIAAGQDKTITALENGGLCLNIGSKFAVQLGLPERLGEKIDYVRRKLEEDPGLVASGKTLNLVSLDRPSYALGVAKKER